MKKYTTKLMSVLFTLVMLLALLPAPAQAANPIVKDTIYSVAITVDRPIVGEPLSKCVPETTLCQITCTWNVRGRGLEDFTEIPPSTIAKAGETYYLAMILTPKVDLYTFDRSVTGTVNGKSVTVKWISDTMVTCMALLTPKTKADTVDVSVPQPAFGATAGTPTVTNGRTVTTYTWYKTANAATDPMQNSDVFDGYHTYYFTATVSASANEVFTEGTTITVNGKAAGVTVLSPDPEANTITFRYDVTEILNVAPYVGVADGNGGSWLLGLEETQTNGKGYTASYRNGVLTLTNTGDSTISGFYNYNDAYYCGIYAGGNLNIRLEGNFCFTLEGVPETAAHVYGIYVSGDLNLVNSDADVDHTVSFLPAEGILATTMSSGIHCKEGSLSIQNESQKGFTLNARGVGVRPVNGAVNANFTNNGIYADGSITIGDNCTVNATAADVALSPVGRATSSGIYAYRGLTIGENAAVTATGGNINPSRSATTLEMGNYQYCYGVQAKGGSITVNGGTLEAKGGNIDYGSLEGTSPAAYDSIGQDSYGIYANDTITLSGGAITARAGYSRSSAQAKESSLSEGIRCYDLTVSSGTLEAHADDAWKESTGLCVRNNLTQTGGTIKGTGGVAVCIEDKGDGSRGIYVVGTLTASGGSLTGTGGTIGRTVSSVGLQAGKIELSGTAQVTGLGGLTTTDPVETPVAGESSFVSYPGDSIGVWTFHNLTVDGNAVLTATGGTVRGNNYSPVDAMSIGLDIITADDCTISGSGKIVATGGETHYGSNGCKNCDSSHGIYGGVSSLTIDGTTVIATGGNVSTKTVSGNGVTKGGESYGLYLPGSSLTLQNGAELTATGGDNPTYSDNYTQKSTVNNSYGGYVGGDITVTDSVFTATGGLSIRTVGLYNGGTVTLNGLSSRLTATADEYYGDAPGAGSEQYCYGAMNGDGYNPGGAYTVNGGILLLQGKELAMSYQTNSTLTAATIWCSYNWDGSNSASHTGSAELSSFYARKYVKADSSTVNVTIKDWTYGDAASTLTYTTYEGAPTILYAGTTRAGVSYSSATAPTEAGSYTVTVTYPDGQTGSSDFTVKPRSLSSCSIGFDGTAFTYTGEEQTKGVTITYYGKKLVEGTDYTLSGNTGTNVGSYQLTITGKGNFEGTATRDFTIDKKMPEIGDFMIPEIGTYPYTGEIVELPLPTLKEPYTGGGTITMYYDGGTTPPSAIGEYTVTFSITEGTNFTSANNLEYGTLVIKAADISDIVLRDLDVPQAGKSPDKDVSSGYTALYSVRDVRWLDDAGNEVNSFEEGKFYTAEITVSANDIGAGSGNRFNFAESVTASIDGTAVTGEGCSITVNDDDTVTIRYKFPAAKAPSTAIHGTVTVTGTASVTVENFSGTKATLIVAQYSGSGQMMALRMISVTANGTFAPVNPFTHADGCTYKAFLLNADTYAPLCGAADLE